MALKLETCLEHVGEAQLGPDGPEGGEGGRRGAAADAQQVGSQKEEEVLLGGAEQFALEAAGAISPGGRGGLADVWRRSGDDRRVGHGGRWAVGASTPQRALSAIVSA